MIRGYFLIAFGILFACTSLFGQNLSSEADSTAIAKPSAGQSVDEHGMYVSGFEIPNGGRNVVDLGFYHMSMVRTAGTVDPQGAFTDLCVAEAGGAGLDEKAVEAVTTSKFEPATLQGEPVPVRILVEVNFRLY
jgi:TonB family protein